MGSGRYSKRERADLPVTVRSYSGNIEYVDQIINEDQILEMEAKGRRGILKIEDDKRPKCQPIGAQIDCRCCRCWLV